MKLCCLSVTNVKTTLQAFAFIFFQHRYGCTDATKFSMFSLAPMLPMSDVRIGQTLMMMYLHHHYHQRPKSKQNRLYFTCPPLQICDYGNEHTLQHQFAHSAVAPHQQHNQHRADRMLTDKCTDVLPTMTSQQTATILTIHLLPLPHSTIGL